MAMFRRTIRGRRVTLVALAALLAAAAPSAAEWLVLRDGVRLEIRGELRVEKRRVVFTRGDGTLSALPLAEVDLDATAAANLPPPVAEPPAPAPPRVPIVRFTDADFGHADDVGHPTIRLFTTSWCPCCRVARAALSASGARYDDRDVDRDADAQRIYLELSPEQKVPVIAFDDEVVISCAKGDIDRIVAKWRIAEAAAAAAQAASRRPPETAAAPEER